MKYGITMVSWDDVNVVILSGEVAGEFKLKEPLSVDYIVLAGKFNESVSWILNNFLVEKVILDGSLKGYKARKFSQDLSTHNVDFYSVYHDGALTIDVK